MFLKGAFEKVYFEKKRVSLQTIKVADQPALPRFQRLCYFAYGKVQYLDLLRVQFNVLASLCSGPGWFESHFVGNPEARISQVMAHMYMCVGCGCSLLLIYVFSLGLRAPRRD